MKKVKIFVELLLISLMFLSPVNAIDTEELAHAGESVKLDKEIQGSSFTAGNNVDITSRIDGINFAAGNIINDSSTSDYSFIAGNQINLNNISTKDLFIAGNIININSSTIKRDVYVAGSEVNFDGIIGRNMNIAAGKVVINGNIKGNVVIDADTIEISDNVIIEGTLKYNEDAKTTISKSTSIVDIKTYKNSSNTKKTIIDSLYEIFISFGSALLCGAILLALFRKYFEKISSNNLDANYFFKHVLIGLVVLVVVPIISIILMITGIGLSTSLITLAIYSIIIYLSNIITGYYFSKNILSSKITNEYLILLIGLFVIYFARLIPIIGGLVSLFSLLFGIGLISKNIKEFVNKNKSR